MNPKLTAQMQKNIRLFGVYKVFTKRVFLPLTTIYASQVAGLSVAEIGATTAAGLVTSLVLETTAGFWADKHGRKNSARIGALLACIATLMYVFFPSFAGILMASITIAIGYAFLSGSMEALIHDSLVVLKRTDDYAKVASRAQSLSLIVSAVIIALVPLLYPIDKRLPFIAGTLAYLMLFLLASSLTEPSVNHESQKAERTFIRAVRHIVNRKTVWFFAIAGLAISLSTSLSDLYSLSFLELGMSPEYIGLMYATASVAGAALGYIVHHLRRLSFKQYATLDLASTIMLMVAVGVAQSLWPAIVAFIINMAFWRYQSIMYQHYILQVFGATRYKATLLSVTNNFQVAHAIWLVLVFTSIGSQLGVLTAISMGVWVVIAVWPILMLSITRLQKVDFQPAVVSQK
jgi:MFS family permease